MKCYHMASTKSRKPCPICGQEMRAWMNYCSKKCSGVARTTTYEMNCKQCNNSFRTKPSAAGVFCSRRCCSEWQKGQKKVDRIKKNCENCGIEFEIMPGEERQSIRVCGKGVRFCSNLCIGKYKSKQYGYEGINRICENCGNSFIVEKPCVKTKCCSHTCAAIIIHKDHNEKIKNILPEIKEYRKTHSAFETKNKFGFSISALNNWGIIGPKCQERYDLPTHLTTEQEETIIGNLLGDGSLSKLKIERPNGNSNFIIGQKGDRAEYIYDLYNIYSPFSCNTYKKQSRKPSTVNGKINHKIENWNGEYIDAISMYTFSHPIFTELRKKWYKDPYGIKSQKIIPRDIKLTWRIAAFWACDDGSNSNTVGKSRTSRNPQRKFTLYTDCFLPEDVEFLIERLKEDLGVIGRLNWHNEKPIIIIYGEEQVKFVNGIRPYIPWNCFAKKTIVREKLPNNTEGSKKNSLKKGKERLLHMLNNKGWQLISEYTDREMQIRCEHGKIFTRVRASLMSATCCCDCNWKNKPRQKL